MDRVQGILLFIRVVETGSFSKAAASLSVTQPTATKHVAALEQRLGSRLLHRSTRGVMPTEVGALYYERCKAIAQELEAADNLASLLHTGLHGSLSVNTSVAFGRRVLMPMLLQFMREHPQLQMDLSFDDRYVNLVESGVDIAIRMGRLSDSTLGSRYLGSNPWVLVGSPAYLQARGVPQSPLDLAQHDALIYSSVQGDERWHFAGRDGRSEAVPVKGPLRSNSLSALLDAVQHDMGLAILPWYVAGRSVRDGAVQPLLTGWTLPSQEIHAVFPSPRLVPRKVSSFITWLQGRFGEAWWMSVM